MKKQFVYLLVILASFTHSPSYATVDSSKSQSNIVSASSSINLEKAKSEAYIVRLNEIKNMDKSTMTSAEKKVLRKEVRTIKAELAKSSGGIYLSVGAILLVILLLILLL